jgi:hypothetical protein
LYYITTQFIIVDIMAPLKLNSGKAQELDAQIWRIYNDRLGGDELAQLAKLFKSNALLKTLHNLLSAELPPYNPGYNEKLEIKLAWIDKRPLAKLAQFTKRVELGDAVVFYFDQLRTPQKRTYRQARALILQAKVAKEKNQISCPTVPINPGQPSPSSTTMRELTLLSNWTSFDLYKASASRAPIIERIVVSPSSAPPSNGWYMATPKTQPSAQLMSAWTSPWMCAPAHPGTQCSVTFGGLIWAFLTCSKLPDPALPAVGEDFHFDLPLKPSGQDWSRLCNEILRLCPSNQLPPSLFGRGVSAIGSTIIRSLPYLGNGDANWLTWLRRLIFRPRMPVLFIVLTRNES